MQEKELSFLRRLFSDIVRGHTVSSYKNDSFLIKHFTVIDQGFIDTEHEIFYNQAIQDGLPNEKERLQILIDQECWTTKDEAWIDSQRGYISGMEETKSKLTWLSQIEDMQKQIGQASLDLNKKLLDKKSLLGITAESYAIKKLNEKYIYYAFRKRDNINEKFFTEEDFFEMSSLDLGEYIGVYNDSLKIFELKNLKSIGLASFMQSMYSICNENCYDFYGRPVCELTFYMTEIFQYAKFFRHILSQDIKYDEKTMGDPDLLINAFTSSKNSKDLIGPVSDDDNSSGTMIFGTSRKDIRAAGGVLSESLVSKAIKEGKSIGINEAVSHHKA